MKLYIHMKQIIISLLLEKIKIKNCLFIKIVNFLKVLFNPFKTILFIFYVLLKIIAGIFILNKIFMSIIVTNNCAPIDVIYENISEFRNWVKISMDRILWRNPQGTLVFELWLYTP
jgi:hypothetical protein